MIRKREIDLVNLEIKIFTKGLQKNNPGIKLSSPIKYLRKYNFDQITRFFLHPSNVIRYITNLIRCVTKLK